MDVIHPDGGNLSDVVSILIALSTKSTSASTSTVEAKVEDIAKSARLSMSRVLSVMPAVDFIDTVLVMLSNEESMV